MKKKIKTVTLMSILALITAIGLSNVNSESPLSDIALANIEALAQSVIVGMPCLETPYSYCIYLGPGSKDYLELPGTFHE